MAMVARCGSKPADRRQAGAVPFCLSDPTGTWRIVATDVVSGVTGQATVDIVAAESS
jgi:hypothetical protein